MPADAAAPPSPSSSSRPERLPRVLSIDALRGLVVFTMIFVNDLAGVSHEIVPGWLRHHPPNRNGMTFVDLVFPAFLFTVGLSIPCALGARLRRDGSPWPALGHVLVRTASLLLIGIVMVNEAPDAARLHWSPALWSTLMYFSVIVAFSSFPVAKRSADPTPSGRFPGGWPLAARGAGFLGLALLVAMFQGEDGHRIVTLAPFAIHTSWYGILGLIGWAYLVGSLVFLVFRMRPTALLGCLALLLCLYPAERSGAFEGFWLARFVGIGGTLGSLASITVGGVLLAAGAIVPGSTAESRPERNRFVLLFVAGCAAAALLLRGLYGIDKNSATPSWCLWACAITAALWLVIHLAGEGKSPGAPLRTMAAAGGNVLLAYLLSEMLPSLLTVLGLDGLWERAGAAGLAAAIGRSLFCAALVLFVATRLNRIGLRLRL